MRILLFIIALFITIPASTQIFACTGFFATQGDAALVGNNEDYFNTTQTKIVIQPPESKKYGRLFFGFDSSAPHYGFGNFNPQGGMVNTSLPFIADRQDQASASISMGVEFQTSYAKTEAPLPNGFCQRPGIAFFQ